MTRLGQYVCACLLALGLGCAAGLQRPTYPPAATAVAPDLVGDPDVAAIRSQYERLAHAFAARDVDAILAVRSADFEATFPNGERQTAEQMREMLKGFFILNKPPIKTWNTLRSITRAGPDTITVTVFQQASRYQELAGKLRRVEHDVTQDETWRREGGTWKLLAASGIRNRHRWVDGTPIDPSKPFDPKAPPYKPKS